MWGHKIWIQADAALGSKQYEQKSIENICIEEVMENFEKRRKTKHMKEKNI